MSFKLGITFFGAGALLLGFLGLRLLDAGAVAQAVGAFSSALFCATVVAVGVVEARKTGKRGHPQFGQD